MSDALRSMIDDYDIDPPQDAEAVAVYHAIIDARDGCHMSDPTRDQVRRAATICTWSPGASRRAYVGTYRTVLRQALLCRSDLARWVQSELRALKDRRDYLTAGLACAATELADSEEVGHAR